MYRVADSIGIDIGEEVLLGIRFLESLELQKQAESMETVGIKKGKK